MAFAGRFATVTRDEAAELAAGAGALPVPSAGEDTNLLVIGADAWPVRDDGRVAENLERAQRLRDQGQPIEVIDEAAFLGRLGLRPPTGQPAGDRYTTTQLSRILKLPRRRIRAWIRRGLIAPVATEHRIEYFDFRQVAELKRLAELAENGVAVETIRESLRILETWFPETESAIRRLDQLEGEDGLLVRLGGQLAETTGQLRLFDPTPTGAAETAGESADARREDPVPAPTPLRPGLRIVPDAGAPAPRAPDDSLPEDLPGPAPAKIVQFPGAPARPAATAPAEPTRTPDEWFEVALECEEAERPEEAARAYREALMAGGPSCEIAFNLGNVLFSLGRWEEALSRFQQAVETDPDFAEAWNNLASVHAQFEEWEDAIQAGHRALELAPEFADAHYNLAEAYHASGRETEARHHARKYLRTDGKSPWAERLKQNLALT